MNRGARTEPGYERIIRHRPRSGDSTPTSSMSHGARSLRPRTSLTLAITARVLGSVAAMAATYATVASRGGALRAGRAAVITGVAATPSAVRALGVHIWRRRRTGSAMAIVESDTSAVPNLLSRNLKPESSVNALRRGSH
jgi:hypothetical protein